MLLSTFKYSESACSHIQKSSNFDPYSPYASECISMIKEWQQAKHDPY